LTVSSGGTLNIDTGASLRTYGGLLSNSGTINVNFGELGIERAATNTASGQINVTSANAHLSVVNTLTNQGTISARCGAIDYLLGGTISGNPPQTGDCTPPTATPTQSAAANAAGWNNSDVTVTWHWVDNAGGSGVDPNNCTTGSTSSGDGTLTLTATCKDLAGNQGSGSYTVKVDKTQPTISAAAATAPNGANGWYTSPVTVDFTCADALSGVATCPSPQTLSGDGSAISSTAQTATDNAGNASAPSNVVTVKIDQTPPTITANLTPLDPASTGWYNQSTGAPTVSFTCNDATSGIPAAGTPGACPLKYTFPEGANLSYTASVSDNAGNKASAGAGSSSVGSAGAGAGGGKVIVINVDLTPPTITASATKADGSPYTAGTWTNQSVLVHFTCVDALSDIGTCPADPTLSADGITASVSGIATDQAGNRASVSFGSVQIDKTPPTVTYSGNAGTYTVDQPVQITCTATDATSGVASSTCQSVSGPAYSFGLGTHSFSATAKDNAGNIGSQPTSFKVVVTPSSLTSLINRFCTDPSVAASLNQNVTNIAHAPNPDAKAGMLQGFTHVVQAQTGKSLTSDQANVLITLAAAL
jgi:hypothetical protein